MKNMVSKCYTANGVFEIADPTAAGGGTDAITGVNHSVGGFRGVELLGFVNLFCQFGFRTLARFRRYLNSVAFKE